MTETINPYAPPNPPNSASGRGTLLFRWRTAPTALFGLLGIAAGAISVLALVLGIHRWFEIGNRYGDLEDGIIGCIVYAGIAMCWLFAAVWFWKGLWLRAAIATTTGFLIPVVLLMFFGG